MKVSATKLYKVISAGQHANNLRGYRNIPEDLQAAIIRKDSSFGQDADINNELDSLTNEDGKNIGEEFMTN